MGQGITGGALNPTIGLCAVTFRLIVKNANEPSHAKYIVTYMLGPILSGILAGVFIRFFAIRVTPEPAPGSPFLA